MKLRAAIMLIIAASVFTGATAYGADFADVPKGHWAYDDITQLRSLGVTDGLGDGRYGVDEPITRAQFASFLCKLFKWDTTGFTGSAFSDNQSRSEWYFGYIEAAAKNGVFMEKSGQFRPNAAITRGEMAVMLVRSLGFGELAGQITGSTFTDVTENVGYIALAQDFGIIRGVDDSRFAPDSTATRTHAAVMMMRMYSRLNARTDFLNGFYAIKSAGQMDYISELDSVGYGWSRLEWNGKPVLNMTSANGNEYAMPDGYEKPLGMAKKNALLMVTVKDEKVSGRNLTDYIVSEAGDAAISEIVSALAKYPQFNGVVIDFEGMKGGQLKNDFTGFLTALRGKLNGKLLYVAVHPKPRSGEYFDAYDYAAIGELADKVILMAHDYHAKKMTAAEMEMNIVTTPLAPIDQVYYSLKAITDEKTGVRDPSKVVLQFSFDTVQWQSKDGRVVNSTAYTPTYDALVNRIQADGVINYSARYESPYVTYTAADGTANTIWYEDTRSIGAKTKLAKMFGVTGLSLWRLGTVPEYSAGMYLNVWSAVKAGR